MDWKFNLTKMNWKFKLALVFGIGLAVVVLLKLPASQAQINDDSLIKENSSPRAKGKLTEYPNGVTKIEPLGFAVTRAARDMPTADPDALAKRATFVGSEERREQRIKDEEIAKGIAVDGKEDEEINRQNSERVKKVIPGAGAGFDVFKDSLVEKSSRFYAPESMPTPSLTFNGATQADNAAAGAGGVLPPDVNGDVGPNNYVSSVNLVLKMFDKSGSVVAGPIKTSALFAALPAGDPCRVDNDGDPIVLYDPLADRWHVSQFALPAGGTNYQCVALSKTGDPTGAYYVWSYPYPGGEFNDYPKVGVWTDAYHMTFNQFDNAGNTFLGAGFLSQDRKKALVGDPTTSVVYFNLHTIDPNAGGLLPGDIDGYVAPPAGLAEVIGEYRADELGDPNDAIRLYRWAPNFTNPANSTLTVLPDVVLAPFDAREPTASPIEQMGGANLDSLADRSMHRFAYRNLGTNANPINSYVGNFSVNVSGVNPTTAAAYQTGIRWFEMRRASDSFSVFDQGTHNLTPGDGANGLNDWMGSIAQDNRGDIALGFSQAGTTQKADIKIAGRTNNVQNSGTLNEGETLFYPAGGSQTSSSGRWGDYSSMNVDPTDDCTFWYTQEYYAATSSSGWSTRVGKFRYPQCVDAPKATITGTISYCSGGAALSGASVDATGGFNRVTGAPGTYSITVAPGTYTVSAGKSGGFNTVSASPVAVADGGTATADICLTGVAVVSSGTPQIAVESCPIANGAPDPGEQVTVGLPLQNTGAAGTNNLTATLTATGGVLKPSPASQSYGALAPGSAAVTKNFSFAVDPNLACGSTITLTFNIKDGATNYGTVTQSYTTGARSLSIGENFDGVTAPALPANWTNVQTAGTGINWVTTTATPNSAPNAAFANDPATTNAAALVTSSLPVQGTDAQISFKNFYNTEATTAATGVGYDGMVLEYSTDGGTTWVDVITGGGSFVSGGYNRTISSRFGSPIGGRSAWAGNSGGYLDTVVNLPASLNGQTVKFRWLMASDSGVAGAGVRIDDVQIFASRQCSTACAQGYEGDVAPRPGGDGAVSSTDVAIIQGFQLGFGLPYQAGEFQRADCAPSSIGGDGRVTSLDVAQAQGYQLGFNLTIDGALQTASGPTAPAAGGSASGAFESDRAASSVKPNRIEASDGAEAGRVVRAGGQTAQAGQTVVMPINVDAAGDESVYGFSLSYDATKLSNPVVTIGTAGGAVLSNTTQAGKIGVSVNFGGRTIAAGTNLRLINIQFTVAAGAAPGAVLLAMTDQPTYREVASSATSSGGARALPTTFTDGSLVITTQPTAVAVSGRVSTGQGRGIRQVVLTLADDNGNVRTTTSGAFGYYRFSGVAAGRSYTVAVRAKHYSFSQPTRLLDIAEDTGGVDFVGSSVVAQSSTKP